MFCSSRLFGFADFFFAPALLVSFAGFAVALVENLWPVEGPQGSNTSGYKSDQHSNMIGTPVIIVAFVLGNLQCVKVCGALSSWHQGQLMETSWTWRPLRLDHSTQGGRPMKENQRPEAKVPIPLH